MYISFIILFFIIAPILLLYSSGYKYDWSLKKLIKTGLIVIEVQPRGADIILNNKAIKKTPTTLTNLLPGTYTLKLEKEGYLPWQGDITIKSGKAKNLSGIMLFRDLPGQIIFDKKIFQINHQPNSNKLFLITQVDTIFELYQITLGDSKIIKLFEVPTPINIETYEYNNNIIISTQANDIKTYYKITLVEPAVIAQLDFLPSNVEQLQWSDQDKIFGLINNSLCLITLSDTNISCDTVNINSYSVTNNAIYYFSGESKTTYLYKTTPNNFLANNLVARLPYSENYVINTENERHLIITDTASDDLFLVEPDEPESQITMLNEAARAAFWLNQKDQLIYYNDFEIWYWDTKEDERILLTRVSEPIRQVIQLSGYPYLLFSQTKTIQALEIEAYSAARNITPLIYNASGWLAHGNEGKYIYYIGPDMNQIWQREIR